MSPNDIPSLNRRPYEEDDDIELLALFAHYYPGLHVGDLTHDLFLEYMNQIANVSRHARGEREDSRSWVARTMEKKLDKMVKDIFVL